VMETHEQNQQWLGVADIMRAEAREEADAQLAKYSTRAHAISGILPECVVREGDTAEEVLRLIDEDVDVFILVLGAGTGSEGPGPLVATIGRTSHSGRYRARPSDRRRDRRSFGVMCRCSVILHRLCRA
jgi:nucleotide-binding universal stress UspA family protein